MNHARGAVVAAAGAHGASRTAGQDRPAAVFTGDHAAHSLRPAVVRPE